MVERNKNFFVEMGKHAPVYTGIMVGSFILGRHRDLMTDNRILAALLERPRLEGLENIPRQKTPLVIVGNHPPLHDLFVAASHINIAFNQMRNQEDTKGDILWMVAKNLQPRTLPTDTKTKIKHRVEIPIANMIVKGMHRSYDLLPVSINYRNPRFLKHERAGVLLAARKHLTNDTGSMALGVFPEGDFENQDNPPDFQNGIGTLIRVARIPVHIMPVGIYRDEENKLIVRFGRTFVPNRLGSRADITSEIQGFVRSLTK